MLILLQPIHRTPLKIPDPATALVLGWAVAASNACSPDKASGADPAEWEGGIYHVEVTIDTADPLSDTGDEGSTGEITDQIEEALLLQVYQFDYEYSCSGIDVSWDLVAEMRAWTKGWYVELALPPRHACFFVQRSFEVDEVDVGDPGSRVACYDSNEEALHATGGEEVAVELVVRCELRKYGGQG